MIPWLVCALLAVVTVLLTIKITMMKKSMDELCEELETYIKEEASVTVTVSSGDRSVRRLAIKIDEQLKELRRLSSQYRSGDRELKDAVTNISHDLRTPLTALCGYLDLLEKTEQSEDAVRYTEQIRNRTDALKQLIEELFRYSVITSEAELNPEKLNICAVLEETLIGFEGAMKNKGITPEISIPSEPLWRELDKTALVRIFGNIINNAVKYSSGNLEVNVHESGRITFSNKASELTDKDVKKLFERFYTADPSRKSTGLGLSIAKLLTEKMNGIISAELCEGKLIVTVNFIK